MATTTSTVRSRLVRVVTGLFAVAALGLTLTGTAHAVDKIFSHRTTVGTTIAQRTDGPLKLAGSWYEMTLDQRQMPFGAQWIKSIAVDRIGANGSRVTCGELALEVTRYQAYSLHWRTDDGRTSGRLLYRGGLVADSKRPYAGVFFLPGNKVEIRTFDLTADEKEVNAWTAASTTVPGSTLVLERDGLSARTGTGKPTRVLTGPTSC